jgi:hypothetical protein
VSAHTFDIDELGVLADRRGVGVRSSASGVLTYDLAVVATDVTDTVRAAGGWLCDRVRAGWDVTVYVPAGSDPRALAILGVTARVVDSVSSALRESSAAALAMHVDTLTADAALGAHVRFAVERGATEVTLWGTAPAAGLDHRVARVEHRLSAAAEAFKRQALAAGAQSTQSASQAEEFRSCALWYPPESSDLVPVG